MAKSEQPLQEKKMSDRIWSLISGLIILLISAGLTYTAFFEKRSDQNADIPILNITLLLTFTWSLTVCCFCYLSKRPFLVRTYRVSGFLSAASLMIFLLLISLKEMLTRHEQQIMSFDGTETFFVLIASLVVVGIIIFSSSKYREKKQAGTTNSVSIASSPLIIFIWPILILARNLFGLFWLFCVIALTTLGNWIGAKLAHPFLGALIGLALLPISGLILLACVSRKERLKGAFNKDVENPQEPSQKNQT